MASRETNNFLRYVIQRHARGQDLHWDFMLEWGDILRTWRLDKPPEQLTFCAAKAHPIADHPLRFLMYEGPVNQGAGTVAIADRGAYSVVTQSGGVLDIRLRGEVLRGLFRMEESADGDWRIASADALPQG